MNFLKRIMMKWKSNGLFVADRLLDYPVRFNSNPQRKIIFPSSYTVYQDGVEIGKAMQIEEITGK